MDASRILNGRYRLEQVIGEGGMSVVWQAVDDVLERPVAVKVLSVRLSRDATASERLRQEAKSIARLTHPSVARVYDYGVWTDPIGQRVPFVVMELLSGQTLNDRLATGRLPIDEAQRIGADVAAALAAAHEQDVVHRDIKPSNIMLCRSGAKVFDFGISAMVGVPEDSGISSPLFGTPSYMAPERLIGETVVAASDVYALGVLLYRMLADELPVRGASNTDVLAAQVVAEPEPLPPLDGLPPAVADLCLRCLAKRPEDRPSAAEAALVLAAGAPAPAHVPVRMVARPRRTRRRALLAMAAAVVAATVALVAFGGSLHTGGPTRAAQPPSTGPATSRPSVSVTGGGQPLQPPGPSGAVPSSGSAAVVDPTGTAGGGNPPGASPGATTPPAATPTATGGGTGSGDTTLTSTGGSVAARCSGTDVFVASWQAAPGFTVSKAEHGPKAQIQVMFDPDDKSAKKVTMHISCSNGVPATRNT